MPRQLRLFIEGMPQHVVQRGNYRQKVFEQEEDFRQYCYWMAYYANNYNVEILAYCLLFNHVHFIVIPKTKREFSLLFHTAHMCYSQYKNAQQSKKGHLWQGRFYSSILDDTHLYSAMRYVEQNPVRAKLVTHASDYIWSSARFHMGLDKDPIIKTVGCEKMSKFGLSQGNWKNFLFERDEKAENFIRQETRRGGIIATPEQTIPLKQKLGLPLIQIKKGRPKKNREK